MHIQVEKHIYIYHIRHIEPVYMFICAFMILYTCIYVYIGVFWLAFGLALHQLLCNVVSWAGTTAFHLEIGLC